MNTPAGWYNDPEGSGQERWWDGMQWTENFRAPKPAQPAQPAMGGVSPHPTGPPPHVDTWLWQSIVVTLLCCWPLGIPAIVFASKANGAVGRGDIVSARAEAQKAKTWTFVALGAGLLMVVLSLMFIFIGGEFTYVV